jgi:F-type H+-transporting ATPase subunit gamma
MPRSPRACTWRTTVWCWTEEGEARASGRAYTPRPVAKTREIRKRIRAVGNLRRITKTMQMIATSKFARAQQRALAGRPYADALRDLVARLCAGEAASGHPLIAGPARGYAPGATPLTLIITSDRGLCGPYNGHVLRAASALFADGSPRRIELVGRKGAAFLRFRGIEVSANHSFGDRPRHDAVHALARSYIDAFLAGDVTEVGVVSMRYISAGRQAPDMVRLLPLRPPKAQAAGGDGTNVVYEFSPSAADLLDALLPASVTSTLFQCLSDAIVSEHVARMIAMKAATDNAGKMGRLLTRRYNRARQAQITTELTEIISGAAALR